MIEWIDDDDPHFPPVASTLTEPDGLLAASLRVTPLHLLRAYPCGIFPWYNPEDPPLWWSPNPRTVLIPERFHIAKSLRKTLASTPLRVTFDWAFTQVMTACAAPRGHESGTWINQEITRAYSDLHRLGVAHSVEVWRDQTLVGGLYGVALGKVFFGESMFSRESNASKIAFAYLVNYLKAEGFAVIDCQVASDHLHSLGAEEISRDVFSRLLNQHIDPKELKLIFARLAGNPQTAYPNWSNLKIDTRITRDR